MTSPLQLILSTLADACVPGATGKQLEVQAAGMLEAAGVEPAFLGYGSKPEVPEVPEVAELVEVDDDGNKKVITPKIPKVEAIPADPGFPSVICVSINNEVIHGVPDDRPFEEGDLVKVDIGLRQKNGDIWAYDDGATTVLVGGYVKPDGKMFYPNSSARSRNLLFATAEALEAGVAAAKEGNTTLDIAKAIEAVAKKYNVTVVQGYGGHGIGEELHMPPFVPNHAPTIPTEGKNDVIINKHDKIGDSAPVKLVAGMRLAIEPMFCTSKNGYSQVDPANKWTVKLVNQFGVASGLAAHFERTITI